MPGNLSGTEPILVVRAGALGDTLMATPVLRALSQKFPESAVDVLCSELAAPLLELRPGGGEVLPLRYRNLPLAISLEKRRLVKKLRDRRYAFAVLLERAPRYRRLLERAGIGEIRSFRETPFDPAEHAVVNNLRAAGFSGADESREMEVHLAEEDGKKADELLRDLGPPRVGVHIGYGPRGRKKTQSERLKGWPLERFAEVARGLLARGASLVLTGSREDAADVDFVRAALPEPRVRSLAGRTSVRELAAVIGKLDLFLSVDSGPAHLAAAVGTPLVVLWGPAIFEQVRPLSNGAPVEILRHPPPCAPCYDQPWMKTCRRNVCMESITPGEVLTRIEL
jgi:ADP-heptose:LPS heptosyltransferase